MTAPFPFLRRYGVRMLRGAFAAARYFPPQVGALLAEATQNFSVHVPVAGRTLTIVTPNMLCYRRAETLYTKEPETIRWMETFTEGEILWDIGANIGLYSLYAGARGVRVRAFEPDALNYALLNRNIAMNRLDGSVLAYAIAIHDRDDVSTLNIALHQWGGALSSFGHARTYDGASSFTPEFRQGAFGYSVDTLAAQFRELPNHLKVDVDGNESLVLAGAARTLQEPTVRSLLIELDEERPDYPQCLDRIAAHGFSLREKTHATIFDTGPFARTFNHVFTR